mmetsp:Transcript_22074/g.27198  ORF Transcript_22074/g.27198 Transcript_22074/m.27198 type:complete len:203 (+) Transcript_22074:51-659(+)
MRNIILFLHFIDVSINGILPPQRFIYKGIQYKMMDDCVESDRTVYTGGTTPHIRSRFRVHCTEDKRLHISSYESDNINCENEFMHGLIGIAHLSRPGLKISEWNCDPSEEETVSVDQGQKDNTHAETDDINDSERTTAANDSETDAVSHESVVNNPDGNEGNVAANESESTGMSDNGYVSKGIREYICNRCGCCKRRNVKTD